MKELFDTFPNICSEMLTIKKMTENDIEALSLITENDNVYRFIPPFLYKKSKGNLLAAIRNLGGRDFDKKKLIIAGIYLSTESNQLIGLAEMFDYKKKLNQITIGYRLNEDYWHCGIATEVISMLKIYLVEEMNISTLKAFVMEENIYSSKALLKNGFTKSETKSMGKNWGGYEIVELDEYTFSKL